MAMIQGSAPPPFASLPPSPEVLTEAALAVVVVLFPLVPVVSSAGGVEPSPVASVADESSGPVVSSGSLPGLGSVGCVWVGGVWVGTK